MRYREVMQAQQGAGPGSLCVLTTRILPDYLQVPSHARPTTNASFTSPLLGPGKDGPHF